MQSWPTKEQDMQVAQYIIDKYVELNGGKDLEVLECTVDDCLEIQFSQPEWVVELIDTFQDKYGFEHGKEVALKIISNCMIKDATVH